MKGMRFLFCQNKLDNSIRFRRLKQLRTVLPETGSIRAQQQAATSCARDSVRCARAMLHLCARVGGRPPFRCSFCAAPA